jgi:DNA mismatch endonuclease (patch repair protein)
MMAAVANKDSKAELALRRELHARGVRYRLHARDVMGRPDLVIRSKRLAVFVDGDFWHGNAHRLRGLDRLEDLFPNRRDWWMAKLSRTMQRDREVSETLRDGGWTVVRIWESDVLRSPAEAADRVVTALAGGAPDA